MKNKTVFSFCDLPFCFLPWHLRLRSGAWCCAAAAAVFCFVAPHRDVWRRPPRVCGDACMKQPRPQCPSLSCRVLAARTCALPSMHLWCVQGQCLRVLPWGRCGLQLPALKTRNPSVYSLPTPESIAQCPFTTITFSETSFLRSRPSSSS